MARKIGPTISQEDLYPLAGELGREEPDARLLDLDVEQEPTFLRAQKRVSVRRGSLPKRTITRLTWAAAAICVVGMCGLAVGALYHYGERSWRFRVESSDDIEISGLHNVTRSQVMEVMGGDIGRNIFFVPLRQRKQQLEEIPWVQSASVMRFVPNRLRVEVHERTPVAFARVGSKIVLTDAAGTLMELPPKKKYSFPVIIGINSSEPPSTRSARMKIYNEVVRQLDSGGARYSEDLSEIDLSDPDDVKVMTNNPVGAVLVHLGSANYLERYKVYVTHVREWQQQFSKLESVDLRYDRQIIVNPDLEGTARQAPLSGAAARQAMAAGVKPAALITRTATPAVPGPARTTPPAAVTLAKPPPAKPVLALKATKARPRAQVRRTRARARAIEKARAKAKARNKAHAVVKAGSTKKPQGTSGAKASGQINSSITVVKTSHKPSPAIAKGGEPQ